MGQIGGAPGLSRGEIVLEGCEGGVGRAAIVRCGGWGERRDCFGRSSSRRRRRNGSGAVERRAERGFGRGEACD